MSFLPQASQKFRAFAISLGVCLALSSCASPARMGMVTEPETGLQFGSTIERNVVTDASFYENKKIKIRSRNTSGDAAFGLSSFTEALRSAYESKGYQPTEEDDFGLLVDVNVMYSGQAQSSLERQFTFLGGAVGGLAGAARTDSKLLGTATGVVAGATLGSIIGSYVTEDTYIVVARITFGQIKDIKKADKEITFSRSPRSGDDDGEEERARGFRKTISSSVAVYAGGRNIPQSRVAEEVRQRLIRIVSDFI